MKAKNASNEEKEFCDRGGLAGRGEKGRGGGPMAARAQNCLGKESEKESRDRAWAKKDLLRLAQRVRVRPVAVWQGIAKPYEKRRREWGVQAPKKNGTERGTIW